MHAVHDNMLAHYVLHDAFQVWNAHSRTPVIIPVAGSISYNRDT